jgi:flagellar biosynthesis GTPase FlhF
VRYIDTPGLSDVHLRKQAAAAIDQVLHEGGRFQVCFVLTTQKGRIVADDLATLKLVLDAAQIPDHHYSIIINQVTEKQLKKMDKREWVANLMKGLEGRVPITDSVHFIQAHEDLLEEDNMTVTFDAETMSFLENMPVFDIDSKMVKDVNAEDIDFMAQKFDEVSQELEAAQKRIEAALVEKAIAEEERKRAEDEAEKKKRNTEAAQEEKAAADAARKLAKDEAIKANDAAIAAKKETEKERAEQADKEKVAADAKALAAEKEKADAKVEEELRELRAEVARLKEEAKAPSDKKWDSGIATMELSLCSQNDQHSMPALPHYPPVWCPMSPYMAATAAAAAGYWTLNDWQNGQQKQWCGGSSQHRHVEVNKDKERGHIDPKDYRTFTGKVWTMARDVDGCRALQESFDDVNMTNTVRLELAGELVSHVWEAIQCKNANHVIQKMIVTMNPEDVQFVVDGILAVQNGAWYVVRHCFGCRVVERLLEHCKKNQIEALLVAILEDVVSLCKHQYANYVVQEMLEHGAVEHQQKIMSTVTVHVASLCTDYHGVAVVSQALCSGTQADRVSVACSILRQPGLVLSMARSRHGQEAVKRLLQVPSEEVREDVFRLLSENTEELQRSRYGRVIAKHLLSFRTQPCGR